MNRELQDDELRNVTGGSGDAPILFTRHLYQCVQNLAEGKLGCGTEFSFEEPCKELPYCPHCHQNAWVEYMGLK